MLKRLLVYLALGLFLHQTALAGEYNTVLEIGDPMPVFTDLPAIDGSRLSSKDLKNDIVVLVSLANHCPWVQGMDRQLVDLASRMQGKPVDIIGFSVNHREDDRLPAMKLHAQENGYNFAYIYDESQALGRALGATRTPEYFVFNKQRQLVYMGLLTNSPAKKNRSGEISFINGEPNEFYVQEAINATLAGTAVKTPETRAHGCTVKYEN